MKNKNRTDAEALSHRLMCPGCKRKSPDYRLERDEYGEEHPVCSSCREPLDL